MYLNPKSALTYFALRVDENQRFCQGLYQYSIENLKVESLIKALMSDSA